jgi:hypothetical protein
MQDLRYGASMPFQCPICSCPEYQRVVVPREPGAPYATQFFHCLGCSVMFVEPELFSVATAFKQDVRPRGEGMQDQRLYSDNIRVRFWMAKAKRENGGLEPTSEQMLKVRDRYRQ